MKTFKTYFIEKDTLLESVDLRFNLGRGDGRNVGYIAFSNKNIADRSVYMPDNNDKSVWSTSDLKKIFRWYGNDDLNSKKTGLVKVDIDKGTARFLDQKKFVRNNQDLSKDVWDREYKLKFINVFSRDLLKNQ